MRRGALHLWRRTVAGKGVNWDVWKESVPSNIWQPLKLAHEAYTSQLERLAATRTSSLSLQPLQKAAEKLRISTHAAACTHRAALERNLEDVLSCLWISYRSPPTWTVSTEEWVDSDLVAQRQLKLDMQSSLDENTSLEVWCDELDKFYANSENPVYHQYVEQPHSSEYYQQNPTIFYEHLLYFIASTGKSRHFFPEIPSPAFLEAVERKRYRLDRGTANWVKRYLSKVRNVKEMHGILEHFYQYEWRSPIKIFQQDKDVFMKACGDAMDRSLFLCYPAIPVWDMASLQVAEENDAGQGTLYSLHGPVRAEPANAIDQWPKTSDIYFYVPKGKFAPFTGSAAPLESPTSCVRKWMLHCAPLLPLGSSFSGLTWLKWHQKASQLMQWAESIEQWRHYWFTLPGESVADAFLRRLPAGDPVSEVFRDYVAALRTKWTVDRTVIRRDDLAVAWGR